METRSLAGITLNYSADENETGELVGEACLKSIAIIKAQWGLSPPTDCQILVMTSWQQFFAQAPPPSWHRLLRLTSPLWQRRAQQTWPHAAGWYQRFGRRAAVGIKPARLVPKPPPTEAPIYRWAEDGARQVQWVTCHELTHACSAHLRLPMWLYEGLAMRTVDILAEQSTITASSLALLRPSQPSPPASYWQRRRMDLHAYLYQIVRGYWLTRYLDETHHMLLLALLAKRQPNKKLEARITSSLGLPARSLWQTIDGILFRHYTDNPIT